MSFMPRAKIEVGEFVKLLINIEVPDGRFTSGTKMKIISIDPKGLGLVDELGNILEEVRPGFCWFIVPDGYVQPLK